MLEKITNRNDLFCSIAVDLSLLAVTCPPGPRRDRLMALAVLVDAAERESEDEYREALGALAELENLSL